MDTKKIQRGFYILRPTLEIAKKLMSKYNLNMGELVDFSSDYFCERGRGHEKEFNKWRDSLYPPPPRDRKSDQVLLCGVHIRLTTNDKINDLFAEWRVLRSEIADYAILFMQAADEANSPEFVEYLEQFKVWVKEYILVTKQRRKSRRPKLSVAVE